MVLRPLRLSCPSLPVTRLAAAMFAPVLAISCGLGSCEQAVRAAADLHWQPLARKWDCALLAPVYQQTEGMLEGCLPWKDPRNGSGEAFLHALGKLARQTGHAELAHVPWCLWGHSGGGFWASLMQVLHPERIVAIWFRSGTAFEHWEKGRTPKPQIPSAALEIPMMCNPGKREDDGKPDTAWTGTRAMFQAYRLAGAPMGFAPYPHSGHWTGDSRCLALPFFDACFAARLPEKAQPAGRLRRFDPRQDWLAAEVGRESKPASDFAGDARAAIWLPGTEFARAWLSYVVTGEVADTMPPPPTTQVKLAKGPEGVMVTWEAEADLKSGLRGFIVQRNGREWAWIPDRPIGLYGSSLFQGMSFGDTPLLPLTPMRFFDRSAPSDERHSYAAIAVNGKGLQSAPVVAR